ncbi:FMN-binding protein [Kitasatospora sp. NPDC059973]|uniref:FMN-binding protein n=1 Tax=Kitasatospora sp. NPDC059973 TaxID=3347020 RepID=UPI003680E22B
MRRAVLASTVTAAGVVLLLSLKPHGSASPGAAPVIGSDPGGTASAAPVTPGGSSAGGSSAGASSSGASSSGDSSPSAAAGAGNASGTRVVTGNAVDTRYGPVQVRITLSGGRITKAEVVQYPSESRRDLEINQFALPRLNQEAVSAQSARVDAVAGATYTSEGYQRSLQSALDQAGV